MSRWAIMWGLATAVYSGCKWLTWSYRTMTRSSTRRNIAYLLAWPGMDAAAFLGARQPRSPRVGEWSFAFAKLLFGIGCLWIWARRWPPVDPYWLGWVGMVGIIFCLHFGSFHVLSCGYRSIGIDARPLMNWPIASTRLADYWGQRWNTAFRDLMHKFVFRPLTRRIGPRGAVWVGFFVSGVIHDVVISFPAGGGYGGPTLFFLAQAAGMSAERSRIGRRIGLGSGVPGWLFTLAVLLVPARLLFHEPFVTRIIVPFMHAIGAAQ